MSNKYTVLFIHSQGFFTERVVVENEIYAADAARQQRDARQGWDYDEYSVLTFEDQIDDPVNMQSKVPGDDEVKLTFPMFVYMSVGPHHVKCRKQIGDCYAAVSGKENIRSDPRDGTCTVCGRIASMEKCVPQV